MKRLSLTSLLLIFTTLLFAQKPRVIVSSDIGGNDPDDFQSMVHYLVYSNEIETEGLISSPPYAGRDDDIYNTIDKYEQDYNTLKTWGDYPTPNELRNVTKQGATDVGGPANGDNTAGSDWIIQKANESNEPLYVLVWGSITDVAQAVYDDPSIKNKIRDSRELRIFLC